MRPVPTTEDVQHFLTELRTQRKRLAALATSRDSAASEVLAEAIDDVGERLVVADEELRVQSEQIAATTHQLDVLVRAHEDLFANASIAYVQTDADGVIIRYNHAARALLGLPGVARRSLTLVSVVEQDDRPTVRRLISTERLTSAERTPPAEVCVLRPDHTSVPVFLTVRPSTGIDPDQIVLHWEIRERAPHAAPLPSAETDAAGPGSLTMLARAATAMSAAEDVTATAQAASDWAVRCIPSCTAAGIMLHRSGRLWPVAATCDTLRELGEAQHELGQGPAVTALRTKAPVAVADLAADNRWPALAERNMPHDVGATIALPLARGDKPVGVLTLMVSGQGALDDTVGTIALAYAAHAGVAMADAEIEANLRIGLTTRAEIGRAVGVVMAQQRISAAAAFDLLVYASQHAHAKLRDIAAWVCETGEDPANFTERRLD